MQDISPNVRRLSAHATKGGDTILVVALKPGIYRLADAFDRDASSVEVFDSAPVYGGRTEIRVIDPTGEIRSVIVPNGASVRLVG